MQNSRISVQFSLEDFKMYIGERYVEPALSIIRILKTYLSAGKFTGTLVFTVNCKNGGIGNISASVQKNIGQIT